MTNYLNGILVVNTGTNLPGPIAAARLSELGAQVIKVEPPSGDPFESLCPAWYRILIKDQQVIRMDLNDKQGCDRLDAILLESDLLITSIRPKSLERLNLGWYSINSRFPQLSQVAILGYPEPNRHRPGHDLTYQAEQGLVAPPGLPRTLMVDLLGAEKVISLALALLLARHKGGVIGYTELYLSQVAEDLAAPLRYGLTTSEAILGGGLAGYNLYPAQKGWVAIAALESRFWRRFLAALNLPSSATGVNELGKVFLSREANEWEAWADERDLPIVAVSNPFV